MADKDAARGIRPDPFTFVIFGASGNLAQRKLLPALLALYRADLLPDDFEIVGFARSTMSDDDFREKMRRSLREQGNDFADTSGWQDFAGHLRYVTAHAYDDGAAYDKIREMLGCGTGKLRNRLFYLAVHPSLFLTIIESLGECALARGAGRQVPWSRIVVEKPFGQDLTTARALNRKLNEFFAEDQVFRIDHYLGKETVQNILVLRFANSIFEPLWHQLYVDHVQITIAETAGVEGRGQYYDRAGALRDMIQNHAMHLLTLVAMEPPASLDADAIRDEKVKVLRALRPIPRECVPGVVVRAQYGPGFVERKPVPAYREEPGVARDSKTETFVALRCEVDNWRWSGVPFYLRSGKRLATRVTEIGIHFRRIPKVLFNLPPTGPMTRNVLALRIQPDESVMLRFQVKVPGPHLEIKPFEMDFGYAEAFGKAPPDAYQRLLLDALLGDQTLFARGDELEAAWEFVTPLIEGCLARSTLVLPTYPAGSWGPKEADELLASEGRQWELMRRAPKC
ncbi:MAG: glucose-6-phosphate dehydrogenase [Kiritimatiellia bacterium]